MLWWLLQNTIIAAVLALGVLVVCRQWRISPAGRHLLWLVVLVKLVTPPFVVWPWAVPHPGERFAAVADVPESKRVARSAETTRNATPGDRGNGTVVRNEVFIARVPVNSPDSPIVSNQRPAGDASRDAATVAARSAATDRLVPPRWKRIVVRDWLLAAWGCGASVYLALQLVRIHRMASRLRVVDPPPDWLADEIRRWAERLRVSPPTTCLVPGVSSPFLWSLRRVRLIWPQGLTTEATLDAWRGVIVHELAHLKRRDHWVGWLELVAGCAWWWNPLFWYVRNQIRENAELACDAWVVETLPGGRRQYAEALLTVCEHISRPQVPAVAIGVGGARRNLERRLTMILKDRVPSRVSRTLLCASAVLALLILPGWAFPPDDPKPTDDPARPKTTDSKTADQFRRDDPKPKPDPVRKSSYEPVRKSSYEPVRKSSYEPGPRVPTASKRQATSGSDSELGQADPTVKPPTRRTSSDTKRAISTAERIRQLQRQLQLLQSQPRALGGRSAPTSERMLPMPSDLRHPKRDVNPLSGRTSSNQPAHFGSTGTVLWPQPNKEVVATLTITLQRTTYRVAASRAKALEAFLKMHVKAEVLQIELGKQPLRTPTAGSPMGPTGGGVGGPMGPGGMAPAATMSVMTITTTPDVQKAIGGIIALMRKSEIPGFGSRMGGSGMAPGARGSGLGGSGGYGSASGGSSPRPASGATSGGIGSAAGGAGFAIPGQPGSASGGAPGKARRR